MKIIVDVKNYARWDYHHYHRSGDKIRKPKNPKYVVGQVVVIPDENSGDKRFVLAVVLGCIDESHGMDLRTDMHGMVAIDTIRPANIMDFDKSNISYREDLHLECQGYKVTRDWETYEYSVDYGSKD